MSITGAGTYSNPYKDFSDFEFNRLTRESRREIFFAGNYHHSVIFEALIKRWIDTKFRGITPGEGVRSYIETEDTKPSFNYNEDFPFDLESFLGDEAIANPSSNQTFINYLTQKSSSQLLLVAPNNDTIIPIFHKPLIEKKENGELVKRILKLRFNSIFGISKNNENDILLNSK